MAKRIGANRRKNLAEKKKKVRKSIRFSFKRILTICAAVVALSGLIAALVFGVRRVSRIVGDQNLFTIQTVRVQGIERIDTATVITLSGLQKGESLIRLNKKEVAERIEGLCWVAEAKVGRRFPSTVVVEVTERKPIALVAIGEVYLTDESGVLIDLPKQQYFNLPVFTGLKDSTLADGKKVLVDEDTQRLQQFIKQVHKTQPEIARRLAQASFDDDGSVRIGLEASSVVIALEQSRVNAGITHLWQILQSIHAQDAQTPKSIDLRYSNIAYVQ